MSWSWRAPVLVALLAVVLAGCGSMQGGGSGPSRSPSLPASTVAGVGEVRGQVLRPPGLDPRSGGGGRGGGLCHGPGVTPVAGDPIEARDPQGRVVATSATDPGGFFSLSLAPGPYRVVESIFGVGQNVEVRVGATTSVTLTIASDCSTPGG